MSYKINDTELATLGFIPGRAPNSNVALEGAWDMPARMGKSFHSWRDEQGVEPYVASSEVRFGGTDVRLHGIILGEGQSDALNKAYAFAEFFDNLTDLASLQWQPPGLELYVQWGVLVNGEVEINYIDQGVCTVVVPFRQPQPDNSGATPAAYSPDEVADIQLLGQATGFGADTWASLGMTLLEQRHYLVRPKPKEQAWTKYQYEGYQVTPVEARKITWRFFVQYANYGAFDNALKALWKRFSNGLQYLTLEPLAPSPDRRAVAEFFVTEGFTAREVNVEGVSGFTAVVTLSAWYAAVGSGELPEDGFVDLDNVLLVDTDGEYFMDLP